MKRSHEIMTVPSLRGPRRAPPPSLEVSLREPSGFLRFCRPFSAYAARYRSDRAGLLHGLNFPVLLWRSGLCCSDPDPDHVTTRSDAGFNPTLGNPLVLQVLVTSSPTPTHSPLVEQSISLGRSEQSDVVVANPRVSRLHAIMHFEPGTRTWMITDAGSRNGTAIDGVVIRRDQSYPLKDGAHVGLGGVELQFLLPQTFVAYLGYRHAADRSDSPGT